MSYDFGDLAETDKEDEHNLKLLRNIWRGLISYKDRVLIYILL